METKEHNEISKRTLEVLVKSVVEQGGTMPELMTVFESVILGIMIMNVEYYKQKPRVSAGLVDYALQNATERFVQHNKERKIR